MKRDFADQYGNLEQWHWWFHGRQQILETVLRRELPPQTSLRLASVGCGPVEGLAWLLPLAGPSGRVIGLDADVHHGHPAGTGLDFVVATLNAIPLASGSLDVVLALDVLEHLDDDVNALREIRRILKPAGLLIVTVPAMPSLWGGQDMVSEHRRRYTRKTLHRAFAEAGFGPPRMTHFNTFLFPPIALTRWMRAARGSANRNQSDFAGSHPGVLNRALAKIFSTERYLIGRVPLWFGVSLLAICSMPNSRKNR